MRMRNNDGNLSGRGGGYTKLDRQCFAQIIPEEVSARGWSRKVTIAHTVNAPTGLYCEHSSAQNSSAHVFGYHFGPA